MSNRALSDARIDAVRYYETRLRVAHAFDDGFATAEDLADAEADEQAAWEAFDAAQEVEHVG